MIAVTISLFLRVHDGVVEYISVFRHAHQVVIVFREKA